MLRVTNVNEAEVLLNQPRNWVNDKGYVGMKYYDKKEVLKKLQTNSASSPVLMADGDSLMITYPDGLVLMGARVNDITATRGFDKAFNFLQHSLGRATDVRYRKVHRGKSDPKQEGVLEAFSVKPTHIGNQLFLNLGNTVESYPLSGVLDVRVDKRKVANTGQDFHTVTLEYVDGSMYIINIR